MPCVVGPRSRVVTGRQGTAARSPKRTVGSGDARGRPAESVQKRSKRLRSPPPIPHDARTAQVPQQGNQIRSQYRQWSTPSARPQCAGAPTGGPQHQRRTPRRRSPGTGAALTSVLTPKGPADRPAGPFACPFTGPYAVRPVPYPDRVGPCRSVPSRQAGLLQLRELRVDESACGTSILLGVQHVHGVEGHDRRAAAHHGEGRSGPCRRRWTPDKPERDGLVARVGCGPLLDAAVLVADVLVRRALAGPCAGLGEHVVGVARSYASSASEVTEGLSSSVAVTPRRGRSVRPGRW